MGRAAYIFFQKRNPIPFCDAGLGFVCQLSACRINILPARTTNGNCNSILFQGIYVQAKCRIISLLKNAIIYGIVFDQIYLGGRKFAEIDQRIHIFLSIIDPFPDNIFIGDSAFGLLIPIDQRLSEALPM